MEDMGVLRELFTEHALLPITERNNRYQAELTEPRSPETRVEIIGLPADSLILKVDRFPDPGSLFKGSQGECKRADFAIISEERRKIVYIEIKFSTGSAREISHQLAGAHCVLTYCREVASVFWKRKGILEGYDERYVVVSRLSMNKKRTREHRSISHDSWETPLRVQRPGRLQYNHLAGA
ncbi:MAG: hypothetical protein JJU11_18090 [Candidatus Sumerlaeia bacterium]|nr:hypothetical protein [Candidatus Sumerlaeia bacterium]